MNDHPTRRDFLKTGALAAGALTLAANPLARAGSRLQPAAPAGSRKLSLRVAHLTDIHVEPELHAAEGLAAALHHVQSLDRKPELILTGGDHVFDCFAHDEARTKLQWELLHKVFKGENSLPVQHTIGNHDVWGWNKGKSKTSGNEPMWGKKWTMDQFGMARTYHSFDQSGWHFVCLDSIDHDPANPDGYVGNLGEEQLDWLASDLAGVKKDTPVLVLSHIPILSVTAILGAPEKGTTDYKLAGAVMHADSHKIRALFARHPNVKLALSGHTHRIDRVDFLGVTYLCNGAVSGNWWKGAHYECHEGYAVLDLYDDGTFENKYVTYGWKAQK
jgi:3',5'-cyclic AMP phosphodiesterase CpdA